jgi:hypothetical protein
MKLRKKTIWSVNLYVGGDLQHRERYLTLAVEGARDKAAAERKATNIAWKRLGCILADTHVIASHPQEVWY